MFLPFSNANYHNTWYTHLAVNDDDQQILNEMASLEKELREMEMHHDRNNTQFFAKLDQFLDAEKRAKQFFHMWLKVINESENGKKILNDHDINRNRREWYANNCIFREEEWEGDKGVNVYKTLLTQFLEMGYGNDLTVAFFINPRDFPVLHQDHYEPYEQLYGNVNVKDELSNEYYGITDEFAPILSFSGKTDFVDIPTITTDDWEYTSQLIFPEMCNDRYRVEKLQGLVTEWAQKTNNSAIFRGTATGCGMTIDTNMRMKACVLSKERPELIDAKISAWNIKLKKTFTNNLLHFIGLDEKENLRYEMGVEKDLQSYFMTAVEQSKYKFILNLDGHSRAFRLGHSFSLGSVILLPQTQNYLWFEQWLVPLNRQTMKTKQTVTAHYIPVRADLSDLVEIMEWCQQHDEICEQIAQNGKDFFEKYLSRKEFQFEYLKSVFELLSNERPEPFPKQLQKEYNNANKFAIVVAYRDNPQRNQKMGERSQQLAQFTKYMALCLQGFSYDIIVAQQTLNSGKNGKENKFNLGKTKNIGVMEAIRRQSSQEEYSHYIVSDIDMVPDLELLSSYVNPPLDGEVIALASHGTVYEPPTFDALERLSVVEKQKWYYDNFKQRHGRPFLGGVISVSKNTFLNLNGFPNNFWGWGGEDDELLLRVALTNTKVLVPKGRVIDLEEDLSATIKQRNQLKNITESQNKENQKYEKLALLRRDNQWQREGVNSLIYEVKKRTQKENIVMVECDVEPIALDNVSVFENWYHEQDLRINNNEEMKKKNDLLNSIEMIYK